MDRRSGVSILVLICLIAAAGFSAGAAPQGFFSTDLTIRSTQSASGGRGGGREVTTVNYLSGNTFKYSSSDGMDSIVRLDEGKMISVDNNKKTYTEITFKQLQETADALNSAMSQDKEGSAQAMAAMRKMMGGGADVPISVTKLGAGESIAGYATEKYLVKGPMEMEIWAAPDLKIPPQYFDTMKARMPRNPMFDFSKMFEEMKKINGYPVKQITTMKIMGMETKSTTIVTAVDKGAIAKSVFDVPAGYKKVEMK
jgi:hypothetical protein